ncbi:MAG: U32 family peptidase [Clostridia bacterium]
MMELLAPAGDRAALDAAIAAGADAVYLGLTQLNARKSAGNFDEDALCRAAFDLHMREMKLYVTLNTLVKADEFRLVEDAARQIAHAGADAVIVQDLGVAAALSQLLPSVKLHASTQMALHNRQGVRFAKAQGFSRVVLAREMTLAQIADCAREGVELEVFGHGALCVSCSGQCLFSSLIGGRSGNRGQCAQPCRLPYALKGPLTDGLQSPSDLLSPRDLMTLDHLADLARAGVHTLKLEGRLKGAEYVYTVVSTYRRALDGATANPAPLREVFNRGYTSGYLFGVDDHELMSDQAQTHVLPGPGVPIAPERARVALSGVLTLRAGERARLTVTDGVLTEDVQGDLVERAKRLPIDRERLLGQIRRTGGTPYAFDALADHLDEDAFLSAAALNALRRAALTALSDARARARRGCAAEIAEISLPDLLASETPGAMRAACDPGAAPTSATFDSCASRTSATFDPCAKPLLGVQASDARLLHACALWGADELIWLPADVTCAGLACAPRDPFVLALPPTLSTEDLAALNQWALSGCAPICAVLASNPAHLALSWPGEMRADCAMNLYNPLAVRVLGLPYVPSVELKNSEIKQLPAGKELIVYGRIPLMTLRHCPLNGALGGGAHASCQKCDHTDLGLAAHALVDRKGAAFPLLRLKTRAGCIVTIVNSVPLSLLRHWAKLPSARAYRVILTHEDEKAAETIVRAHRAALDGVALEQNPWGAALDALPSTTGHYFRGVE